MGTHFTRNRAALGLLPVFALILTAQTDSSREEAIWHHRNLGKAYYENGATPNEAIAEFKKALALAPESIREQLNYALALLRAERGAEAVEALLAVQKKAPEIPHTWFNLGIYYKKTGELDMAIEQFERMIKLVPEEPKSHFNLAVLYRQKDRPDDALRQLEIAARLDPNLAAPHFVMYNILRFQGKREEATREIKEFQRLKKLFENEAVGEDMEWCDYSEIWDPIDMQPAEPERGSYEVKTLLSGLDAQTAGLLTLDSEAAGRADLLVWSRAGVSLWKAGETKVSDAGFEDVKNVTGVASGDFDNDGFPDLCLLTDVAPRLFRNVKGRFEPVSQALPPSRFEKALWVDYDHDYDLDLLLLGESSRLLRNEGSAGFGDRTADFPFVAGRAIDGVQTRLYADSRAYDLVVSYTDHPGIIYLDKLGGRFEASPLPGIPAGSTTLRAEDVNHDGWLDLSFHDGLLVNVKGGYVSSSRAQTTPRPPSLEVAADFNDDGALDKAFVFHDQVRLQLSRQAQANRAGWLRVKLLGVKNLKLAYAAQVEVKAGTNYQKKVYEGVPLLFDLHGRTTADTVRIIWANGLIQNEIAQPAGKAYEYKESQRLSGSCPMIWTWNGRGFEFITDVLGVAPLGASSGDGRYFPVDHNEYIQISGDSLKAVDGRYEIRVTEELSEVSYLDQIQLFAVDHPAKVEIFTNDKWKSPPFPHFQLFGARERVFAREATDDQGRDMRAQIRNRDRVYPDTFRHDMNGVAEMHGLTLDFGEAAPGNRAVLILNGWVDWADGSTFLAAAQEKPQGLVPPKLLTCDAAGRWRTIVEDMGMPSGKPKTMAVDLTGLLPPGSRKLKIVTNLCVYWDEVFLIEDSAFPRVAMLPIPVESSNLRFRGFSRPVIDPQRRQPESFVYADVRPASAWNPTPGFYTRFGDVRDLLSRIDDRLVIMGSGDEIRLIYHARSLPPLKPGWRRDFLLKVDGWAKDRDANTAFSQTVEPLPFHGMTSYPYPAPQEFPRDADHEAYRKEYNTRPALVLIRPLNEGLALAANRALTR